MRTSSRLTTGITALACVLTTAHMTGSAPPGKTAMPAFALTVDSIMRGPKLVGYPPTGLRWSGDSSRLYFEWRRPGDEEPSTYVVDRAGGEPRRLNDEERRNAPPVGGAWDKAHRRVLFVDDGDVVLLDSVAGIRRSITRTTGGESNPRWARHESAVTFVRDNNLFIVPLDGASGSVSGITQLTDVVARKRDPRQSDSQKFIKAEEPKLIEHTRVQAERKKKAEEKEKAHALPRFELAERQSASDLQLSPDDKHVYMLIAERSEASRRTNVPNYVTESSYTEDIPARTFVGDAQDKRMLAVMNLESGKTVWADSTFAGAAAARPDTTGVNGDGAENSGSAGQADQNGKPQTRDVRWGMPIVSDDGSLAVANARAVDNKDRWLVAVDPDGGKSRVIDILHDDATSSP
jgi:hypothetical protein